MPHPTDGPDATMLKIRTAQIHTLSAVVSHKLLLTHAETVHAGAASALGAVKLKAAVAEVVRRCGEYGVGQTDDQLRLMDLAMIFGADWQRPDVAWIDQGMRDPTITNATLRVRKVWRAALRRLDREG